MTNQMAELTPRPMTLPDRTLASEQLPEGKMAKERLSAVFYCNASGTLKLDPWYTNSLVHVALKASNIQILEMKWRANKKAWMTGKIFRDWLVWFNRHVAGRKAIFLPNSFSAIIQNRNTQISHNDISVWPNLVSF